MGERVFPSPGGTPGLLPELPAPHPHVHSHVVLAPGLDADEQAQAVPGARQFRPPLLWEGLEEVGLASPPPPLPPPPPWQAVPPPGPASSPGLTHVQRGGKCVETGNGHLVLAASQVQAETPVEGSLGLGLRGACTVTRGPARPLAQPPVTDSPGSSR